PSVGAVTLCVPSGQPSIVKQAAAFSAAELSPSAQTSQARSCVALPCCVTYSPDSQVVHSWHSSASSTSENVPRGQTLHSHSASSSSLATAMLPGAHTVSGEQAPPSVTSSSAHSSSICAPSSPSTSVAESSLELSSVK